MKKNIFIRHCFQVLTLVWCCLSFSCDSNPTDANDPDPLESPINEDCVYDFILGEPKSNCGFAFDTLPYCEDCPDEEGKLGTYNLLIDTPEDQYSETVPLRPHIMQVHGYAPNSEDPKDPYAGLFLPTMRTNFCRYGFSFSTLEYRQDIKGFNILNICDTPEEEVIKTHYRGIQDVRAALDTLYENAGDYGIDTDNIFVMGNSQGGTLLLNALLTADENEWLSGLPERYHNLAEELGPWKPLRKVKGILIIAGALYDLDYLDAADDIPLFLAHGVCDDQVPYKAGTYLNCTSEVQVYGSYEIACKAKELGKPYSLHSVKGLGHNWNDQTLVPLYEKAREWMIDQVVCGMPNLEEFTSAANVVNCPETSTSTADCE